MNVARVSRPSTFNLVCIVRILNRRRSDATDCSARVRNLSGHFRHALHSIGHCGIAFWFEVISFRLDVD